MRMKSYGSVKVFEPETDKIEAALDRYIKTVAEKQEVLAVWLIGSFHRKDFGPFSDIDLVLIIDSTETRFLDRPLQYLPEAFPIPLDLFVYTQDEVLAMKNSAHPFWNDIEKNHTPLFKRS